jgi:hypothetical protein
MIPGHYREAPLFIKLQRAWGHVAHALVMASLGMAARHLEQSRNGVCGDVDQAGCGSHPAPFAEMVDDGHRLFLRDLRVEQGGAAALGELLTTHLAAQEPDVVLAVYFAHDEIVLACQTKPLAFGVHTR